MEFYIFTLFIFFLISFFEFGNFIPIDRKRIFFYLFFIIIVIQVGFRWETGTDWTPYYKSYYGLLTDYDEVYIISGAEKGYEFLVNLSKIISEDYTFFLTLHAFLYLGMIFYFMKKFSPYVFASILLFYAITLGVWGSNRQLLALGICLVSLNYLYEGKNKIFLLLVFCATFFHSTAFIFLVYYFSNRNFDRSLVITSLIVSFIIGQTSIPLKIFSFFGSNFSGDSAYKVNEYLVYAEKMAGNIEASTFGLIKRLLLFMILTKFYDFIIINYPRYKIIYNGYFFGLIFYFIFSKSLLIMISRGSIYFNIMEIIALPCVITLVKEQKQRAFLAIILFIYSILAIYQSIAVYPQIFDPYKGLFYNADYYRVY